jgi:hypothetical protein
MEKPTETSFFDQHSIRNPSTRPQLSVVPNHDTPTDTEKPEKRRILIDSSNPLAGHLIQNTGEIDPELVKAVRRRQETEQWFARDDRQKLKPPHRLIDSFRPLI